jgi:NAD(P)-dependent dehydrogenase (short-subunit alcohol dehydrogenase family)
MKDYQPAPDLLKNRTILVTGAGDGIGREAALTFARHGATVILLGKTLSKLETVYDEIEAANGPTPAIYPMHLEGANLHDYEELGLRLSESFEQLDGILHNAATLPYLSRIKDYDPEDWMKVIQVNLNAPFFITQACMPLLEKSEDAALIFASDATDRSARAYWGAYSAAKFGQEALMQTLAEELEHTPIRVNSIDPGPTRTNLRKNVFPGDDLDQIKLPAKLMPMYLWLMGPDSKGTHGQSLVWHED